MCSRMNSDDSARRLTESEYQELKVGLIGDVVRMIEEQHTIDWSDTRQGLKKAVRQINRARTTLTEDCSRLRDDIRDDQIDCLLNIENKLNEISNSFPTVTGGWWGILVEFVMSAYVGGVIGFEADPSKLPNGLFTFTEAGEPRGQGAHLIHDVLGEALVISKKVITNDVKGLTPQKIIPNTNALKAMVNKIKKRWKGEKSVPKAGSLRVTTGDDSLWINP